MIAGGHDRTISESPCTAIRVGVNVPLQRTGIAFGKSTIVNANEIPDEYLKFLF
jgi:hypothetical protein